MRPFSGPTPCGPRLSDQRHNGNLLASYRLTVRYNLSLNDWTCEICYADIQYGKSGGSHHP